ncbi:MAG: AbrB/MazE/SpoVT family DNA-binding domain-containing protein [Coprobacillus sp.]
MKTTGMVRRIDELGRIVIPKEIRKQLMMKEGESISFSLENDKIVLTKFSMLNKLSSTVQVLLEGLYMKYQNTFLVCDHEQIIICSSDGLSVYQRKHISQDLSFIIKGQEKRIEEMFELVDDPQKLTILPLVNGQESQGALIMITKQTPYYMMDETLLEFVKEVIEQEIEACV